jgi:Tol biopolymer transport system component
MSPEQARGEMPGPASDIFTYGCVLYEMLCGERPFPGNSQLDQFYKICFEEPLPIATRRPDAPAALAAIALKALAKKPEERFGSMASMVDALKVLVLATSSAAIVPGPVSRKTWPKPLLAALAGAAVIALAAFAAFQYFGHRGTPSTALSEQAMLRRVTYDSGLTGYSAISPNGKLVAYASDRNTGNLDIWTQPLDGGKPVRLTSDPADDYAPSFSPDGTLVVYRSDRQGGGVYMTPSSSTAEELLVPGGFDPKFSPDGKVVASWRGYVGGAFYPGAAGIVLVPLGTRKPQVFRPDFESAAYPIWLSSSRLLFLGRKKDKNTGNSVVDWWVADVDGGEAVPTGAILRFRQAGLRLPPAAYWYKPEAQVNGEVFFSAQRGDATNIWKIPLDQSGHTTAPPEGVTFGASLDASIGIAYNAPQSTTVFSDLSLVNNIWKLDLKGSSPGQPQRLFSDEPRLANPSVSADGKTLLVSTREANNSRIISVDLGTMARNGVADVTGTQSEQFPVLSGDGKHVVFLRGDTAFLTTLADGPVYKLMQNCGRLTHANFDATQVLCDSLSADEKLLLWSHGKAVTLVQQPDGRNAPQSGGHFSPDGRWVVFSEGRPSSPEHRIVVVPNAPERKLKAEEWIAISDGSDSDRSPVWGADGKHIYYISDMDGFTCIRARPVDPSTARPTGPSVEIAHFHLASQTLRMLRASELSLSASSNFLIFTLGELKGNVWMKQVPREAK